MEQAPILDRTSRQFTHLNIVWLTISLVLLGVLAALPPQFERHKQIILLIIAFVQLLETRIIAPIPQTRRVLCPAPPNPAGHSAHGSHGRSGHHQQLLSHLLPSSHHCRALL